MKNGISKIKRTLLIILSSLLASSTILVSVLFIQDSTMMVPYGNDTKMFFIPFYDRDNVAYEDSELFEYLYQSSVEDIVRLCVIKNQMETGGAYDPDKEVDITAFANRNKLVYNSELTAKYRLDDLINWGNKGFDMQTVSSETVPFAVDGDSVNILVCRYKTVDDKDLVNCASTLDEYNLLVGNLISTAEGLFNNYKEYEKFNNAYGVGKTNMLYCIQMNNNGNIIRYTNMEDISIKMSVDDISTIFINQPKYIYYNPDKMTLSTNIKITAPEMKNLIGKYEYSFTDNSRVWIGFDNTYIANDGFAKGKNNYNSSTGSTKGILMIVSIWIMVFAYLGIFIYLMRKEGRFYSKNNQENGDGNIVLRKIDHLPIEFKVVVSFAIIIFDIIVTCFACDFVRDNIFLGDLILVYAVAIGVPALLNFTIMPTILSYVRRIKAKNMAENSCILWLSKSVRQKTVDAYDNGHALIRTWIPYLIFLLINLILLIFSPIGLIAAVVIDLIVGVYMYKSNKERQNIVKSINLISDGDVKHQIDTSKMHGDNLELGKAVNNIGNGIRKAVETSMKDEKMKADLITNVSHDIKTPLTSIISYVDLLKRENISDEKVRGYIEVLDQKSQRLKQLTDDLVEASKISSGNIVLDFVKINLVEMVNQSIGEFEDKFAEHGLKCRFVMPDEPVYISVDSKSLFRIIENLYNNIYKYALHGTRVYIDMETFGVEGAERVQLSFKNISESQLNLSANELLERFKQGDESRKAEGSGLGLSIAKSLTEAMNGQFDVFLDGDLFKVILTFNTIS